MLFRTISACLTVSTLVLGCNQGGAGVPVPPNEKEACAQAGKRVAVTAYFLGDGENTMCPSTEGGKCIGNLVAEIPSQSQGLPLARLQATVDVGDAKNKVSGKQAFFGKNWKAFQTFKDYSGKSFDGQKKLTFTGKLNKQDTGCSLVVDRIDSLDAPSASGSTSAR